MEQLRCPYCKNTVESNLTGLHECFSRPLLQRNCIIDFAKEDHYWNQIPREEMSKLHDVARTKGCKNALEETLKKLKGEYTFNYAWDERRADWYPLCELPEKPIIVDVGAGWGAVSTALARQNGEVYSLDSNIETLEFIHIRSQENKFNNVKCIHVDPLEKTGFPFLDNSVDLVIMNGLLEWVGAAVDNGDPKRLQCEALKEASRILRPGGKLYIGIESRYGFSYWLGKEDHPHTKFTSVVPRFVASLITKRKGLGPYRTYTHSARQLKKMLLSSGFATAKFYVPFPEYRTPNRIIPLESARALRKGIMHTGISRKHALFLFVASLLGLHKLFVDDYSIISKK